MALSVDKVFRFVQFVANKEHRGWISPDEFNIAAELAQIAVYSRLESGYLANKKIHNDMRPFLKSGTMSHNGTIFPWTDLPDLRQFIGGLSSTGKELVEWTQAEYNANINSAIISPDVNYPRCVIRDDGIYLFPVSITTDITVDYIAKILNAPEWTYTVVSNRPVYDDAGTDFTFDDNLFLEIATNILMNVGMNLKDENVTQYGMSFNSAK